MDLVIIRWPRKGQDEEQVSVLFGRCQHRGALMADGHGDGDNLICGLHNRDYDYRTGVSSYNPAERLQRFSTWIEKSAQQLNNFYRASTELMQVMTRACGHDDLGKFCIDDLTT